jgi:hypothetical protein
MIARDNQLQQQRTKKSGALRPRGTNLWKRWNARAAIKTVPSLLTHARGVHVDAPSSSLKHCRRGVSASDKYK